MNSTYGKALEELFGEREWQGVFTFHLGYPAEEALESPSRERRALEVSGAQCRTDYTQKVAK